MLLLLSSSISQTRSLSGLPTLVFAASAISERGILSNSGGLRIPICADFRVSVTCRATVPDFSQWPVRSTLSQPVRDGEDAVLPHNRHPRDSIPENKATFWWPAEGAYPSGNTLLPVVKLLILPAPIQPRQPTSARLCSLILVLQETRLPSVLTKLLG